MQGSITRMLPHCKVYDFNKMHLVFQHTVKSQAENLEVPV